MPASLGQVVTLLEQLLSELAGHHRSAVSVHSVSEVLAREADPCSFPVLKLFFVDVLPFVHTLKRQYVCTNAFGGWWSSGFRKASDHLRARSPVRGRWSAF